MNCKWSLLILILGGHDSARRKKLHDEGRNRKRCRDLTVSEIKKTLRFRETVTYWGRRKGFGSQMPLLCSSGCIFPVSGHFLCVRWCSAPWCLSWGCEGHSQGQGCFPWGMAKLCCCCWGVQSALCTMVPCEGKLKSISSSFSNHNRQYQTLRPSGMECVQVLGLSQLSNLAGRAGDCQKIIKITPPSSARDF